MKVLRRTVAFILTGLLIFSTTKNAYALKFKALTYEGLIVESMMELTGIKLKTGKDYVLIAYQAGLINREDYHSAKANKAPTKLFAANLLRNILDKNTNYYTSPYSDISSLSVNFLYYNMIIEPNGENFYPARIITPLTWQTWIKNAKKWADNRLLFFEDQIAKYPSTILRVLDTGFADLEDGLDIQIYDALKSGFLLNASGITFLLEENKTQLNDVDFKQQMSENWQVFNRCNGELTSGASIEVTITYETNTKVHVSFIYPENYRRDREYVIREVNNFIEMSKLRDKSEEDAVRWVSDYIISNVSYPKELKETWRYAYGAIHDRKAVCTGYSDLFSMFMRELNIENTRVWGYYKDILHTWNLVRIDGKELFVDTTLSTPENMLILTDSLPDHLWDEKIIERIFKPSSSQEMA